MPAAPKMELRVLELDFVERERAAIAEMVAGAPCDGDGSLRWFEDLRETGPGQGDPLLPWLAEHAGSDEMHWFLTQEVAGEAGFEDLVALNGSLRSCHGQGSLSFAFMACSRPTPSCVPSSFQADQRTPITTQLITVPSTLARMSWARLLRRCFLGMQEHKRRYLRTKHFSAHLHITAGGCFSLSQTLHPPL